MAFLKSKCDNTRCEGMGDIKTCTFYLHFYTDLVNWLDCSGILSVICDLLVVKFLFFAAIVTCIGFCSGTIVSRSLTMQGENL